MKPSDALLPKGSAFARICIAKMLGRNDGPKASAEIARQRWGSGSPAAQYFEKANVPAGTTGGWSSDFNTVPGTVNEFFGAVDARSLPGRLPGIRRVPFFTAGVGVAAASSVGWVKEGVAAPAVNPITYRVAGLATFKLAAVLVVTEEQLLDPDPRLEDVLRRDLLNSAAYGLNAAMIDPSNTGVSQTKPASLTSGQGSTDSPAETIADSGDVIDALLNQGFEGDLELAVLVMHPSTAARMSSAARPLIGARGGELAGLPVVVTSACPTDIVVLVDPSAILFASDNNEGEIIVSQQGAVEETTTPTGSSAAPTATTFVSLWQTNSVGLMVLRRVNWAMARPNCVTYVNIAVG